MNNTKYAHELQKKNLRGEQGGLEGMAQDGQLLIQDATAAQL